MAFTSEVEFWTTNIGYTRRRRVNLI